MHLITEAVQNDKAFAAMSGHVHVLAWMKGRTDGNRSKVGGQVDG